ncbi:MAG TPA: ABC transporter permease [Vicinamibacterales bacterium]|nr:ABC transporter permease [Vicinamibacterales bacterium]
MRRAWAVAIKELRQIRRDRRSLLILVFIPALFLFLYGYALNFDIRHVSLAVQDRDATAESRAVTAAFVHSTYFDVTAGIATDADVVALMDADRVRTVLVIPEGYAQKVRSGDTAVLQVIINGDNANSATTILGYVDALLRDLSARMAAGTVRAVQAPIIGAAPRIWYNPELRSTLFLVPGLVAYISMITAVVSTAMSIVREKELGTMEQIRMAPMSNLSFVVGKTLPYLVLSQISALIVILAAMWLFGLPMRGNWGTLSLVTALFLVGALGTGLLVSTVADTQQVAFQAAMLIAFLPTFMLSGFLFPIASMPVGLQYITAIVPAKYFLVALRGVVLKGLELHELWRPIGALTIYAAIVLGLSALRLARR